MLIRVSDPSPVACPVEVLAVMGRKLPHNLPRTARCGGEIKRRLTLE
jgi:hypothetical protein